MSFISKQHFCYFLYYFSHLVNLIYRKKCVFPQKNRIFLLHLALIAKHFVSNFFALPFIILIAAIFYPPSPEVISFFILKILLLCSAKFCNKKKVPNIIFDLLLYTLPTYLIIHFTHLCKIVIN